MNLRDPDVYVLLGELEWSAFNELNDVSDYIWKSPSLLTHEKDIERRKVAAYFPRGGITARLRNQLESVKLNKTFPRWIAMANLFLALSIFENYVSKLLRILQDHDPTVPKPEMTRGVANHLKATKAYGAEPYGAAYYEQVLTAIYLRNCLMHANGLLTASRQADALRTRISNCEFMSSDLRKRRSQQRQSTVPDQVTIEGTGQAEQVVITNDYAHSASFYLKEYFCNLCGTLNPNTALRPTVHYIDARDLSAYRAYQGPTK